MNNARNSSSDRESLAETRDSSRTFGCVGVSTVAHLALLAALAIVPQSMQMIGGDDAGGRESGTVSLMDSDSSPALAGASSATSAEAETVEASVMTDANSEVVMPAETAVVVKPKVKVETAVIAPVAVPVQKQKAPTPVAVAKVQPVIEEAVENEPAPVLLANPPSDDETSATSEVAETAAETAAEEIPAVKEPEVAATNVEAAPPETVAAAKQEPVEEPKKQVAAAAVPSKEKGSADASARGADEDADDDSKASSAVGTASDAGINGNGKEGDGQSSGAVMGPIRDASELKALSGNPNPVYPARDRLARKQGTAIILGRVSADGRVSEVSIEQSSGSANMDSASAQAFRSWRFQPGQQGWVRKPFQFRLIGDAKEVPAPLGKTLKR